MSRNELLIYLRDLRDIEITKAWIERRKEWVKEYYSEKCRHIDDDLLSYKSMRDKKDDYKILFEVIFFYGGILSIGILIVYLCVLGLSSLLFTAWLSGFFRFRCI